MAEKKRKKLADEMALAKANSPMQKGSSTLAAKDTPMGPPDAKLQNNKSPAAKDQVFTVEQVGD